MIWIIKIYIICIIFSHKYFRFCELHRDTSKNTECRTRILIEAIEYDDIVISSEHTAYREIVCGLMYLAVSTRPNIS